MTQQQTIKPDNKNPPEKELRGPRTPYPADRPNLDDQPGSEPDYIPANPGSPPPKI